MLEVFLMVSSILNICELLTESCYIYYLFIYLFSIQSCSNLCLTLSVVYKTK